MIPLLEDKMSLDICITKSCEHCGAQEELFDGNITGNVSPMWRKAGVYDALYNSEGKEPREILEELHHGIADMILHKKEYEKLNPENGWGDYKSALEFLKEFYEACKKNPTNCTIGVWK